MESDRTVMTKFKEKLNPSRYDVHLQDAVCASLYSLAYDSDKKKRIQILKRSRMGLKIELPRLSGVVNGEGLLFMMGNYILRNARQVYHFWVDTVYAAFFSNTT